LIIAICSSLIPNSDRLTPFRAAIYAFPLSIRAYITWFFLKCLSLNPYAVMLKRLF